MIDRDARNRLLQGIDDYMDEKISPDDFDHLLHDEIASQTKDEVIQEVDCMLFESYEDIGTNRLQSDCAYWKFFNRLRLLLISDTECRYECQSRPFFSYHWGLLPILAWVTLAIVSLCLQSLTIFLVCGIPLYFVCAVAFFISIIFSKTSGSEPNFLYAQYPFESFADLLALRRSVPDFASKRFPNKPPIPTPSRNRLIRFFWDTKCPAWVDRLGDAFITGFGYAYGFLWIIVLCPLWVLLSFFSGNKWQTRFIIPGQSED